MKILVVDDDSLLADYIRQSLREEGFAVDLARNCAEGKLLGMVYRYSAMVLDVSLPDGTGFDILEAMRVRENTVPVLMLTSRDSKEDVVRGLDAGADDYLVKPFVVAELGRIDLAVEDCEPVPELGHPLEIRSQEQPVRFGRAGRQAIGDRRIIELVEQPGIDQLDLARVEMRRRPSEG